MGVPGARRCQMILMFAAFARSAVAMPFMRMLVLAALIMIFVLAMRSMIAGGCIGARMPLMGAVRRMAFMAAAHSFVRMVHFVRSGRHLHSCATAMRGARMIGLVGAAERICKARRKRPARAVMVRAAEKTCEIERPAMVVFATAEAAGFLRTQRADGEEIFQTVSDGKPREIIRRA